MSQLRITFLTAAVLLALAALTLNSLAQPPGVVEVSGAAFGGVGAVVVSVGLAVVLAVVVLRFFSWLPIRRSRKTSSSKISRRHKLRPSAISTKSSRARDGPSWVAAPMVGAGVAPASPKGKAAAEMVTDKTPGIMPLPGAEVTSAVARGVAEASAVARGKIPILRGAVVAAATVATETRMAKTFRKIPRLSPSETSSVRWREQP